MDSPKITYKYYSNPAFCAQSEVVYTQQSPCVSPRIQAGVSPPRPAKPSSRADNNRTRTDISDNPLRNQSNKTDSKYANTPDLPPKPGPKPTKYSTLKGEPNRKVLTKTDSLRQIQRVRRGPILIRRNKRTADEKTEEVEMYQVTESISSEVEESNAEEENEIVMNSSKGSLRVIKHRYAVIPDDILDEYSPSKKKIVETVPSEYNVDAPSEDEYREVPTEIVRSVNGRVHRYAIIPSDDEEDTSGRRTDASSPPTFHISSPGMSRKALEATQKLHELLSTPKKTPKRLQQQTINNNSPLKSCASSPSLRVQQRISTPEQRNGVYLTPTKGITASSTPKHGMTPSKSCANLTSPPLPRRNSNIQSLRSSVSPKAQQKLIYAAEVRSLSPVRYPTGSPRRVASPPRPQPTGAACPDFFVKEAHDVSRDVDLASELDRSTEWDRRGRGRTSRAQLTRASNTAIISPRLVLRGNALDTELELPDYKLGWAESPGSTALALAAAMMALCGGLTASLSFYIMHAIGKEYYLELGVLSGFTCFVLGALGFRARSHQLLPNRNYVSGYLLLSILSLVSCGALLWLLVTGGRSDWIVGPAVATVAILCLMTAALGALTSCCCSRPPPDNRVADV